MHWYSLCSSANSLHVYSTVLFPKSLKKQCPGFCSSIEHTLVGYISFFFKSSLFESHVSCNTIDVLVLGKGELKEHL